MNLEEAFPIGMRVQFHPATDLWMRGARYGEVVGYKGEMVLVRPDKLPNKKYSCYPSNLLTLEGDTIA